MTADPKVIPRPRETVLKLMPLPLSFSEDGDGLFVLLGADGRWLAQVNRQVIEEFARRINAHDGLVEALEEARCTVRMVHREFNSDRFTDRYGDGEIATRRLALIDAALAAAKEGA